MKTQVSLEQLRELARNDRLKPQTKIWNGERETTFRQVEKQLLGKTSMPNRKAFVGGAFGALTLVLLALATASCSNGGDATNASKPQASRYSTEPFDLSTTKIPRDYGGHDPIAVFNALQKIDDEYYGLRQDQFETSEQFAARVAQFEQDLPNRVLYGDVKVNSALAFDVSPKKKPTEKWGSPYFHPEYNASEKTFEVVLPPELQSCDSEIVYESETKSGVKFDVLATVTENYRVAFVADTAPKSGTTTFKNVAVEKAQDLDGNVGVLCVCEPNNSWIREGEYFNWGYVDEDLSETTASLDRPKKSAWVYRSVKTKLLSLWFYDVRSGEILAKISSKSLRRGGTFELGTGLDDADALETEPPLLASERPFDLTSTKIAPDFLGHDLYAVRRALETLDADYAQMEERDQFETDEQREERVAQFESKLPDRVLFGDVKLSSSLAFRVGPEDDSSRSIEGDKKDAPRVSTEYDADKKTLTARVEKPSEVYDFEKKEEDGLFDDAIRLIDSGMGIAYRLDSSQKETRRYALEWTFQDVAVAKAKDLTGNVALLLVCKPDFETPKSWMNQLYSKRMNQLYSKSSKLKYPKRLHCVSSTIFENVVRVKNLVFWFYDVRTGEVLAKVPLAETYRDKALRFGFGLNGEDVGTAADDALETESVPQTIELLPWERPFGSTSTKIDPDFLGYDLNKVYGALETLDADCGNLKRDQFETTGQHEERVAQFENTLPDRVLFDDVKLSSSLAFRVGPEDDSSRSIESDEKDALRVSTKYDADKKTLTARVEKSFGAYDLKEEKEDGLFDDAIRLIDSNYSTGTPEMGIAYRLDSSQKETRRYALEWTFQDVAVAKAKDLTGNVAFLIVCKPDFKLQELKKPGSLSLMYVSSTIFKDKYDKSVVRVKDVVFWFYDVRTGGEVLAKVPLAETYRDKALRFSFSSNEEDADAKDVFSEEDAEARETLAVSPSFATVPFDPTTEKVALDYAGHDPVAVWTAINKINDERDALNKNGSETQEEFQARIAQFEKEVPNTTLLGDLRLSSTFAFGVAAKSESIGGWETEALSANYSAALQTLTVKFSGAVNFKRATESTDYFNIRWRKGSKNQGFGVAFRYVGPREKKLQTRISWSFIDVPSERGKDLAKNVAFLCVCQPKIKFNGKELATLFSLDSEEQAKKAKEAAERAERNDSSRYGYGSKYDYDYLKKEEERSTNEADKIGVVRAIRVENATFWFYNARTGEIFAKVPADEAFRGKPIPFGKGL